MSTPSKHSFTRSRNPEQCLRERASAPCRAEALELLALADSLTAANAKLGARFDDWRQRVNDLLAGPITDDLATEWLLEELAMDFRRDWILLTNTMVAGEMRSPTQDHLPLLPLSLSTRFTYERVQTSGPLAEKLDTAFPVIPGWQSKVAVFGSGMAAIAAAITTLRSRKDDYFRADSGVLRLDMFGGYFETLWLLDLLSSSDLTCRSFQDYETILQRLSSGETDILFMELIVYDWAQTVPDPARLSEALAGRPADHPWILLLDTTLLGPLVQMGPLLQAFGERAPVLVLELRSGLKLDQVGLEFSNVGILRVLTPESQDQQHGLDATQFHEQLRITRNVLGNGLSVQQLAVLDAPWIFDSDRMMRHTESVLDNNRRLALALSGIGGLFSSVNHPCLGPQRELIWAESPIVVMQFHAVEDNEENGDFWLAVLASEARKRNLVFHIGLSFGFRHHRCEIVVLKTPPYAYPDGKPRRFFKMAMGSRSGPSLDGIIELLRELAAYADFGSLRLAYPEVKLKREQAVFPDLRCLQMIRGEPVVIGSNRTDEKLVQPPKSANQRGRDGE